MRLVYFRGVGGVTNFGDELNIDVWRHYLPGAFDGPDDGTQFVGIGTLLNDNLPAASRTIVFGAGVGYYGPPRRDASWRVYCVRGPLSAAALDLPPDFAVTDPGALVARMPAAEPGGRRMARAYMPHWESEVDAWAAICASVGFGFIDPRWPTGRVLDALRRTDLLLTEAMHGAIVADALRVPWAAITTRREIKAFKWNDWCQSMRLEYQPQMLPPAWPALPAGATPLRRIRRWGRLRAQSAALLRAWMRAKPVLSDAALLDQRLDVLEDRLAQLKQTEIAAWAARTGPPPAG